MSVHAPMAIRSVGGMVVGVSADARDLDLVERRFGQTATVGAPELVVEVGLEAVPLPERPPDDRAIDAEVWFDAANVWWSWRGVTAHHTAMSVRIGPPASPGEDVDAAVDLLAQYGLAAAAARRDRVLVHGAALGRDGEALLVVGSSGAGKSTLAGAALLAGWSLLGDDLVVVRHADGVMTVEGVARPPLLPDDIVGGSADRLDAELVDPDRGRVEIPAALLATGRRPVRAIVVVGHDEGDGTWEHVDPGARPGALVQGLAVPPVPPITRAHLPMLALLGRRPVSRLRHARPVEIRARRAIELLQEIWIAAGDLPAVAGD